MDEKLPVIKLPAIPDTADISDQPPEESMKIINELPRVKQQRALRVRKQLADGTYDDESKLEMSLDTLLEAAR